MKAILLVLFIVEGKPSSSIIEFNDNVSCLKALNEVVSMEQRGGLSKHRVIVKARCLSKGN